MKNTFLKIISLVLIFAMILTFASCKSDKSKKANSETETVKISDKDKGHFRVGYGRKDVTPEEPVALAGYGNTSNRLSDGYLDSIYVSCIAVSDEKDNTILLFSVDVVNISEQKVQTLIAPVARATGVKAQNIFVNCSHTHSAPDLLSGLGPNVLFNTILQSGFKESAIEAMNDRTKSKLYYGNTTTSALNFVRHYFGDDGTCVGDNHNAVGYTGTIVRHTTDSDRTFHVVKFEREGKKDVLLTSFRAHGTMTGGTSKSDISADWIGALRTEAEKSGDCYLSYFQGAAGNQNPSSRIASEVLTKDFRQYGKLLNEFLTNTLSNMTLVKNTDIKAITSKVALDINHSEDSKSAYATLVSSYWSTTYNSAGCVEMGKPYGIYSQYHANGILSKISLGKNKTITLGAFAIGDIAFSCASYEQFDTNGCFVATNSPFKYTVPVGYTNGANGYIPSSYAYQYGCYEVDIGSFAAGSGEVAANKLVEMLNQIHN